MQVEEPVPVVLITRKGNKQQFKNFKVSAESEFVKRIKSHEQAEREEKEKVKMRTLAINEMQQAEERTLELEKLVTKRPNYS